MIGPTKLCPQGIGLILFDLDDTVVIDGTKVTPRVRDTINLARERGCMACVASGRTAYMVPASMSGADAVDYLVCANGASVHDSFGGVLLERLMTREQVLAAMDALEPLGAGWNAFIGSQSLFEWRSFSYMLTGRRVPLLKEIEERQQRPQASLHSGLGVSPLVLGRTIRRMAMFGRRMLSSSENMQQVKSIRPYVEAAEEGIAKVGCSLSNAKNCERAIAVLDHLGGFEVARMSKTELEITAQGVTKGTGASWLLDYLGIDPACAVAFGDSENDAPLAGACGTFVAMANGDSRIKELADDVCESVYDDGVARWLERAMAEADELANAQAQGEAAPDLAHESAEATQAEEASHV